MTDTTTPEATPPKKRMGRPVGSKNKPKQVQLTANQAALADRLGITKEVVAQQLAERKRAAARKPKVDWEKLARQLQEALESQIKDNTALDEAIAAKDKRYDDLEQEFKMAKLHYVNLEKSHKHISTILSYLEAKIGLDSLRGD